MEFGAFLKECPSAPVWCFQSSEYPLLFFSLWFKQQRIAVSWLVVDVAQFEYGALIAQFETSFLGQRQYYWLQDCSALESGYKKKLLAYLATYGGPHHIALFLDSGAKQTVSCMIIDMPVIVDGQLYQDVFKLLYPQQQNDLAFVQQVMQRTKTLSVDTACLMMQYQQVIGRRSQDFFAQLFDVLMVPDKSLFVLSQHLFAKQRSAFVQSWQQVMNDYPAEFWIAFWSEQLWQAYIFVNEAQRSNPAIARKLVTRLPFSFMQKDWRAFQPAELVRAHEFIYGLDYKLKNGAGTCGLDLFYSTFLLGGFKH